MDSKQAMEEHRQDLSKGRLRLWLRIMGMSRSVESLLRENFRTEFSTTLPRFDVMAALERNPDGMKMSELSTMLRVSNGNITGIIDRLVDDSLAKRSPVPGDRRAHHVSLTDLGLQQFSEMAAAHEAWIDHFLQDFGAEEATELGERFREVTRKLQEASNT